MLEELIRSFLLIFAAELGDKTQIIAMTFAKQFKVKDVLFGVLFGVLLNHGLAILLGNFISQVIPIDFIQIIGGVLFLILGINALKYDKLDSISNKKTLNPIITVAIAFFVGELGDKTQLTAMTLSAEARYPVVILIGTTLGMIVISGLGIFVGSKIGNRIPEVVIKVISSLVFLFFGTLKVMSNFPSEYLTPLNMMLFFITIILIESIFVNKLIKLNKKETYTSSL